MTDRTERVVTADVNLGCCDFAPNVIVYHGPRGVHKLITLDCPTCEKPTEMVERWDGAWYGTTLMCRECCDQWQDGFRLPRPFARNWMRDQSEHIERLAASALTADEYKRWTDLDVHRARCNDDTGDCPQCTPTGGES